jgi:hypothetical protein
MFKLTLARFLPIPLIFVVSVWAFDVAEIATMESAIKDFVKFSCNKVLFKFLYVIIKKFNRITYGQSIGL